jgi:uncharacterized membrane protein
VKPLIRYAMTLLLGGALGLLFLSNETHAGLNFCNDSGQKIFVAVAWNEQNDWKARGWFPVDPRGCTQALSGDLKNRYYWFFANSIGNKLIWSGENTPQSGVFFVTTAAFFYRGAKNSNCDHRIFMRIDVGRNAVFTRTRLRDNKQST